MAGFRVFREKESSPAQGNAGRRPWGFAPAEDVMEEQAEA